MNILYNLILFTSIQSISSKINITQISNNTVRVPDTNGKTMQLIDVIKKNLLKNNDDYKEITHSDINRITEQDDNINTSAKHMTKQEHNNKLSQARRSMRIQVSEESSDDLPALVTPIKSYNVPVKRNRNISKQHRTIKHDKYRLTNEKTTGEYEMLHDTKDSYKKIYHNKHVTKSSDDIEKTTRNIGDISKSVIDFNDALIANGSKRSISKPIARKKNYPFLSRGQVKTNKQSLRMLERRKQIFEAYVKQHQLEEQLQKAKQYLKAIDVSSDSKEFQYPRATPNPNHLDMSPAKGSRLDKMRLAGRVCQRSVVILEGPKYNKKGLAYLRAFSREPGKPDFNSTRAPRLVLPRCCNCCKKSVLGCE